MKTAIIILLASAICYGSESPQRDLYKLDVCDYCFNHRDNPTVLENHVKHHTGRKSDGSRLENELNQVYAKHERGK
jgi:hypothetical protein